GTAIPTTWGMAAAGARPHAGVPATERGAERRARLLEAGLEALGSEGSKGTTVRRVCELARLNPRYFYESFASIDELAVAVFERIVAEAMEAVLEVVARNRDDPEATARAAI